MKNLNQFWALVVDVWDKGLLDTSFGRIFIAMSIVLVAILIRNLFMKMVIGRLKSMTAKTKTHFDDEALDVLERPVAFIPIVMGIYFALDYLALPAGLKVFSDRFVRSLIVLVLFWSLYNLLSPLSIIFRQLEKYFTATMVDWLIKAISLTLIFIGAATVLEIWGIRIGPIIAGLGLLGVAVALGAQDLFKNLIAGILIIAEQRFNPGDWINVDGIVEGTVEDIGFRSTRIRQFDKAPVYVPNARLSDNSLINYSQMTHRRIYWVIGVEYRTTVDQLRAIRDGIESYINDTDAFDTTSAVSTFVRIDRFSDSSIDMLIYCFTKTTVWGEWLAIKEALAYEIKRRVEAAGTSFAFPSQSLYVETLPSEIPEVFTPPDAGKI